MEHPTLGFDEAAAPETGLCQCGCGKPAPIAQRNNKKRGWVKGQPIKYIWGHGRADPRKAVRPGRQPTLFVKAGNRFGRGVVIEPEIRIPDSSSTGSRRGARLRCDCGNEYEATISSLLNGNTQSCNCLAIESARRTGPGKGRPVTDRTGQKHGMLTVIRLAGIEDGHAQWLCRCDCGNEPTLPARRLTSVGNCGCQLTAAGGRSAPKGGRRPGEAARLNVFRQYWKNADARGYAWELTEDDFDRLTSSDCFYCGTPPGNTFSTGHYANAGFVYNGIDRINNDLGYFVGNVHPCCSTCNIAKRAMSFDDFMAWIGRLVAHNLFQPGQLPSAAIKPALRVVQDAGTA